MSQTKLHSIKVRQKPGTEGKLSTGINTEIFLDGMPLRGVSFLKFEFKPSKPTKIQLEVLAHVEEIEGNHEIDTSGMTLESNRDQLAYAHTYFESLLTPEAKAALTNKVFHPPGASFRCLRVGENDELTYHGDRIALFCELTDKESILRKCEKIANDLNELANNGRLVGKQADFNVSFFDNLTPNKYALTLSVGVTQEGFEESYSKHFELVNERIKKKYEHSSKEELLEEIFRLSKAEH